MIFKVMNPDAVREALEGHTCILTDEVSRHKAYFASFNCLYCGGNVHEALNPKKLYTKEGVLPNYFAECSDCGAQFEPYTNIEIRGPQRNPLEDDDETGDG